MHSHLGHMCTQKFIAALPRSFSIIAYRTYLFNIATYYQGGQRLLGRWPPLRRPSVWPYWKIRVLGSFRMWVVTWLHLRWATVVLNICRHGPRDAPVRWPIHLGLLGRWPPSPSWPAMIVCDHIEKYVFWVVFGRGWSRDYTWGGLVLW